MNFINILKIIFCIVAIMLLTINAIDIAKVLRKLKVGQEVTDDIKKQLAAKFSRIKLFTIVSIVLAIIVVLFLQ